MLMEAGVVAQDMDFHKLAYRSPCPGRPRRI